MQIPTVSMCSSCANLDRKVNPIAGMPTTCKAFPDGIPSKYFMAGAPHVESDGTDNGIVYERDLKKNRMFNLYSSRHPEVIM
jgi:hypothetical protein